MTSLVNDDDMERWEDAAAQAGDAGTMLIAGIARGVPARNLDKMSPEEIEDYWPTVTDSSSGDEIYELVRNPRKARKIAASWGSPWNDDDE